MEEQSTDEVVGVVDVDVESYQIVNGIVLEDGTIQPTNIEIKVEDGEANIVEVEDSEEGYEYGIEVDTCDYLQIATNEVDGGETCHVSSMNDVDVDEITEQEIVSDGNFGGVKNETEEGVGGSDAPCEFFMVSTVEEMRELINDYSERTSSHFVAWCKTKHFGVPSIECDLSGHRIQWHDDRSVNNFIQYDGIPHVTIGHYELHCQFGVDKSAAQKEKRRKMKEEGELVVKSRILKTPTKKCGCPAKIVVKHIIRFPEYVIDKDTKWKRNEASAKLKTQLKDNRGNVVAEAIILGRLPDVSEHKFHEILQGKEFAKEVVSRDLAVKAQEYFLQNKSNTEILDSLRDYVITEMFWNQEPPDYKRRKFFPTRKDIRNFNARVRHLSRFSMEEQESINNVMAQAQIKDNKTNISFQIEEKCMNEENDKPDSSDDENNENNETTECKVVSKKKKEERKVHSFVFCHQTSHQQRLIKRYSNVAYLVEIEPILTPKRILTYKMYGLVVQTNVDFQVVGIIICSKQRKDGLLEGLTLFREWNNTWNPKYLLVDFSDVIFDAVLRVFPDSNYFLNPTSCENKWLEFVQTPSNNVREHAEEILTYLKNMQYSLTEDSLSIAAALLEGSEVWQKGEKLRTWFQTSWLHLAKKWVFGYRTEDLIITQHLKLSINDCLHVYKDALHQSAKLNGFIELLEKITIIISDTEYNKYIQRNNEHYNFYTQFRRKCYFSESMHGVPVTMLPYIEGICKFAEVYNFSISHDQLGLFTVRYEEHVQNVDLAVGNVNLTENDQSNNVIVCTNPNQQSLLTQGQDTTNMAGQLHVSPVEDQMQTNDQLVVVTSPTENNSFSQDDTNLVILCNEDQDAMLEHDTTTTTSQPNLTTCDITNPVLTYMKPEESQISNLNNDEREIEIKETEFGWIEYSSKPCPGEYTISFGDNYSHPFCTCSHWLLYRLPCIHMFAIFCKVPGWRYDMLSPLYRVSPVLDIDYSCVNYPLNPPLVDQNNQTLCPGLVSAETQTHSLQDECIFETLNVKGLAIEHLLGQTKDFLQYVNKMAFLFKDKFLHRKLRVQLKDLVDSLVIRVKKKDNCMMFGDISHVLKPTGIHKENGKPLKISTLNLEQIADATNRSKQAFSEVNMKSNNEITVSMIELPGGRNLESVLQALSKNNSNVKVVSASRIIKSVTGEQKPKAKHYTTPNNNDTTNIRIPSKIVTKNIAPNDTSEKPVVFRILPSASFNKGGATPAASETTSETMVELDVNKALPIHLEKTPDKNVITKTTTIPMELVKEIISLNGKRSYQLSDSEENDTKIPCTSLPSYLVSGTHPLPNHIINQQLVDNSNIEVEVDENMIIDHHVITESEMQQLINEAALKKAVEFNNFVSAESAEAEHFVNNEDTIKLEDSPPPELGPISGINIKLYSSPHTKNIPQDLNVVCGDTVKPEELLCAGKDDFG